MIRFKDIRIPKPCSVDYDSLPYDEVKRFCGSCKKHVYDFRGKDEAYFNSIYQLHGKVCGVFYENQIQIGPRLSKQSFYQTFLLRLFGLGLFFKSITSIAQNTEDRINPPTQQHSSNTDSTGIKTRFIHKPSDYSHYSITIYVGGKLYKTDVSVTDGYIYLPESTDDNQEIKVIVEKTEKYSRGRKIYSVKPKEYVFRFDDADKIVVKITYKKDFILFRKKIRHYGGILDY
jgi:hypothetical protein